MLIWDRPNCGASDVCFTGESESTMQADTLAALITHLDLGPTVITGGSGGARVLDAHRRLGTPSSPPAWRCGGSAAAPSGS